jgi:DNA replication protein DnaC
MAPNSICLPCLHAREAARLREQAEALVAKLPTLIPETFQRQGVHADHLRARLTDVPAEVLGLFRSQLDALLAQPLRPKAGFGLVGPTGRGKTFTMAATALTWAYKAAVAQLEINPVLTPGWCPRWANWQGTVAKLKGQLREPGGGADAVIRALCEAPFLVLDDLGAEQETRTHPEATWAVTDVLFPIADERHGEGRATLWTSNLSQEQLIDRYGPRVASRLFSMAPPYVMPSHLPDRRLLGIER